jgi:cytoskeleton-associated protein 5
MSFENNFNEEEEILKATVKLSFAAQCQHAHWKVRSRAYESMVSSSSFDDDFAKDGTKETKTNDYERKNFEIIDYFKEAMHKIVSETNANALDVALERTNQRLRKMIDRELVSFFNTSSSSSKSEGGVKEFAEDVGAKVLPALVSKAFFGRPKAVSFATETFCLFVEMEQSELAIEVLSKASGHKVPKVALAASKCLALACEQFGCGKRGALNWMKCLDGAKEAIGHRDEKVRNEGKRVIVECAKWVGDQVVMEKMKDKLSKTMKGEVEALLAKEKGSSVMKATRFLVSVQKENRAKMTRTSSASDVTKEDILNEDVEAGASIDDLNEDPYDSAEPFSVLKALDKPSTDEDIPKFWEAVVSSNWRHRLHALKQLTDACSSSARLQKEEFMELQKVLKKVISKDANANCVAEASKSIEKLCLNARADFSKDAKMLLSALLDKLKDKNAFVTSAIANTLDAISLRCFAFCDSPEDVVKYGLQHKVGKAKLETLKWLTRSSASFSLQEAKKTISASELVATVVKLLEDKDPETRKASQEFLGTLAGRAGGMKTLSSQHLAGVDDSKMKKMNEICAKITPALPSANSTAPKKAGAGENVAAAPKRKQERSDRKNASTSSSSGNNINKKNNNNNTGCCAADLSLKITDALLRDTADGNWKRRSAALDKLKSILDSAPSNIEVFGLDALFSALRARFTDSNANLASQALQLAGQFALKCGENVEKVGRLVLSDCAKHVGDSKRFVREAAFSLISDWGVAVGEAVVLEQFANKFVELATSSSNSSSVGTLCADGKREAMDFCRETIEAIEKNAATAKAADDIALLLQPAMAFAAVGFKDKSSDVRVAASNLFETAMKMERTIDAASSSSNSTTSSSIKKKRTVTREDALKAIEKLPHGLCSAIDARINKEFPIDFTSNGAITTSSAMKKPAALNIPENYKNLGTVEKVFVPPSAQKPTEKFAERKSILDDDNMDVDNLEVMFDNAVKENVSRSSSGDFFQMCDLKQLNVDGGKDLEPPVTPPARPSIWDQALARATADEDDECVEGLKALCHEMNAHAMSDAFKHEISGTIGPLLMFLSDELPIFFENAVKAKKKCEKHKKSKTNKKIEEEREEYETLLRGCKYALMTMHAVLKESILANGASEATTRNVLASVLSQLVLAMDNSSSISSFESTTTVLESSDYLNALNALAEKAMENFSKTNSMVSLIKLLSGEGVPDFSSLGDANAATTTTTAHHLSKKNANAENTEAKVALFETLVAKCLVKLAFQLEELVESGINVASIFSAVHEFYSFKGEEFILEGERDDEYGNKNIRIVRAVVHEVCKLIGPSAEKYAKLALTGMNVKIPELESESDQLPSLLRQVRASLKILSGEDEIESKVREELSGIFAKIGDKDTTVQGLEQLYNFTKCEEKISRVDVNEHLRQTSSAFQAYVNRGLAKVENSRKKKLLSVSSSTPSAAISEKENGGSSFAFRATPRNFGSSFASQGKSTGGSASKGFKLSPRDVNIAAATTTTAPAAEKSPVAKAKSAAEEFRERMNALTKRKATN